MKTTIAATTTQSGPGALFQYVREMEAALAKKATLADLVAKNDQDINVLRMRRATYIAAAWTDDTLGQRVLGRLLLNGGSQWWSTLRYVFSEVSADGLRAAVDRLVEYGLVHRESAKPRTGGRGTLIILDIPRWRDHYLAPEEGLMLREHGQVRTLH